MWDDDEYDDHVAEFGHLWGAETPDDLHRVLALYPPVRASANHDEPLGLLRKHHEDGSEESVVTALLLLTDRRWRKGVHRLAESVGEAGVLDAEELDLLAETFIRAEDAVFWEVPDHWFDGGVEIQLVGNDTPADDPHADEDSDDEDGAPEGPAVVRRDVHPPLRRWAAAHLVRNDLTAWAGVRARARDLGGRAGAAVLCGLVDGAAHLPNAAQKELVEVAVGWPDQSVRLAGFGLMAEHEEVEVVHERAILDSSARVRSWAAKLLEASPEVLGEQYRSAENMDGYGRGADKTGQSSLF